MPADRLRPPSSSLATFTSVSNPVVSPQSSDALGAPQWVFARGWALARPLCGEAGPPEAAHCCPRRACPTSKHMATIARSIELAVPVRAAYDQWTQFEEFPRFMEGVKAVEQLD